MEHLSFSVRYLYYLLELCDSCISTHLHLPEHPLSARSCGWPLLRSPFCVSPFSPLSCPVNLRSTTFPEHQSLFSESSAWTPFPCAVVWKAFLTREYMQMRSSPRMSSFALGSWFCASCCPMPIKSFLVHFTQLYTCVQWEAKTESLKTGSNSCGYSYSFSFFFSFFFFFFSVTALFYLEPSHSLSPLFLPSSPPFFLSFHPPFFCH